MSIENQNGMPCPFRNQMCTSKFGSCNDVFVAITRFESRNISKVIEEVLNKYGYRYYEALKDTTQTGKDAFCVKICSKIIESSFCIVVLNKDKKSKRGNPNVYFEYAMMKYLGKYCIPIANYKTAPEFDILSHDIILYKNKPKSLKAKLDKTLKDKLDEIEKVKIKQPIQMTPEEKKLIEVIMDKIELSKSPEALHKASNAFNIAMFKEKYMNHIKALPFLIKNLDHVNEDVSRNMIQTLRMAYRFYKTVDKNKKEIQKKAIPKILKLVNFEKNGSIRAEAFDCLLSIGDEDFIKIYISKAVETNDEEYQNLNIENKIYDEFITNYKSEIFTALFNALEDETISQARRTRIGDLLTKLEDQLKG